MRDLARAYVMLAARRAGAADRAAVDAAATSERLGLTRLTGRSFGVRAEALTALARPREARDCADAAVALLESHGTLHALASAYDLSARLTRNKRHAARATELRGVLVPRCIEPVR